MKLPRRKFLHLAAGAAALPASLRIARAQGYPSRPVRIIVGFPAGSNTDILARLMGQWLSERLGQPFIVENQLGAGGNEAHTNSLITNWGLRTGMKSMNELQELISVQWLGSNADVMLGNPIDHPGSYVAGQYESWNLPSKCRTQGLNALNTIH